ncbi:cationic amino acid transporter 2-like [Oppia nitens]|uniref:cationic amino acid transporter 2-like n=1 Tax=Oppia nitens TaxID=1686743 RepID=UPI0023DB3A47|nr:cationic amino acid transporter 2-like [Oppia nitens]
MLGIGSTLGLGVYILAGQVASTKAGPSVTLSFFIAAVASVFAGLCYAEFGARVPKSGSAYVYSYITVGEFMAFIIGWNLILEYAIGSASIARGYSGYVDSLVGYKIQQQFTEWAPLNFGISKYFDFFAFAIAILISALLAIGVKKSTRLNAVFTVINVLGVIYAIICGSFKIDIHNWQLSKSELPPNSAPNEQGGFFAFGFSGLMAGAATCFYGFIGFDMIATTGEEVKNPARAIPLSIIYSLLVIFVCYCGVSAIQTLMVPYYEQNQMAPLPYVFNKVGYPFAQYILTIGAMAGLYSSLMGTMYPLTRILYAMGSDRMIFGFFSKVNGKLKTPHWATLFAGIFSGFMAAMFDFQELADMMSIGTLLAYALVSISVLILRYQRRKFKDSLISDTDINDRETYEDREYLLISHNKTLIKRLFNVDNNMKLTKASVRMSRYLIVIICILVFILAALLGFLPNDLYQLKLYALLPVFGTLLLLTVLMIGLKRQPQTDEKMSFKIPGVPVIPVLSVFVNIYLMIHLSSITWIRFGVWMVLGMLMYFFYGINNNNKEVKRQFR